MVLKVNCDLRDKSQSTGPDKCWNQDRSFFEFRSQRVVKKLKEIGGKPASILISDQFHVICITKKNFKTLNRTKKNFH